MYTEKDLDLEMHQCLDSNGILVIYECAKKTQQQQQPPTFSAFFLLAFRIILLNRLPRVSEKRQKQMQNQQDIFQQKESASRPSIQTTLETGLDATKPIPG